MIIILRRPPLATACWLLTWLQRRMVFPQTTMVTPGIPGRTTSRLTCSEVVHVDRGGLWDFRELEFVSVLTQMRQSCGWLSRSPRWRLAVCLGGVSGPGASTSIWMPPRSTKPSRCRLGRSTFLILVDHIFHYTNSLLILNIVSQSSTWAWVRKRKLKT